MGGRFTEARKILGWAATVYLAPHPVLAKSRLYKELEEVLITVATGSPRLFVALPVVNREAEFRESLIGLLKNLKGRENLLDPFKREMGLPIVYFNWQIDFEDAQNKAEDAAAEVRNSYLWNFGKPIRAATLDGSYYVSEQMEAERGRDQFVADRVELAKIFEACSLLNGDEILNEHVLASESENSELFILKPSFYGVGIDLKELFRRISGSSRQRR